MSAYYRNNINVLSVFIVSILLRKAFAIYMFNIIKVKVICNWISIKEWKPNKTSVLYFGNSSWIYVTFDCVKILGPEVSHNLWIDLLSTCYIFLYRQFNGVWVYKNGNDPFSFCNLTNGFVQHFFSRFKWYVRIRWYMCVVSRWAIVHFGRNDFALQIHI